MGGAQCDGQHQTWADLSSGDRSCNYHSQQWVTWDRDNDQLMVRAAEFVKRSIYLEAVYARSLSLDQYLLRIPEKFVTRMKTSRGEMSPEPDPLLPADDKNLNILQKAKIYATNYNL